MKRTLLLVAAGVLLSAPARAQVTKADYERAIGLREKYQAEYGEDPGAAYYSAGDYTPVIPVTYWSFRLMIGLGMIFDAFATATLEQFAALGGFEPLERRFDLVLGLKRIGGVLLTLSADRGLTGDQAA